MRRRKLSSYLKLKKVKELPRNHSLTQGHLFAYNDNQIITNGGTYGKEKEMQR